jgi:hypothetical protein
MGLRLGAVMRLARILICMSFIARVKMMKKWSGMVSGGLLVRCLVFCGVVGTVRTWVALLRSGHGWRARLNGFFTTQRARAITCTLVNNSGFFGEGGME